MGATQVPIIALTWLKHNSTNMMVILTYLILLDFVSGFVKAFVTKTASSDFSTAGFVKKAGLLCVVAIVYAVSPLLPQLPIFSLSLLYFIGSEGLSGLENLAAAGVPIPPVIKSALLKLRESGATAPKMAPQVLSQTFNNGPMTTVEVPTMLMERPQHHDPPGTGTASFRSSTGTSATAAAYLDVTNRHGIWGRMFPWHRKKE